MTHRQPIIRFALPASTIRLALLAATLTGPALAQPMDLSQGGPVEVTSSDGIEWRQDEQVVVARGNARAVREGVTLEADRLIARYRSRPGRAASQPATAQPGGETPLSGGEIWRMEAEGRVRISTQTERAQGDRAVYDMDQSVMVLTGRDLRLTTPENTITARDGLEYWAQRRMTVARGAATVTTSDDRRIQADTLVAYFREDAAPQPAAARPAPAPARGTTAANPRPVPGEGSKLDRAELFGNVEIRTPEEVVRGDRGVYSPVTGVARLLGNVRITRGENQLNGAEAIVNLRSNVARLVSAPGSRVQGLILPQSGAGAPTPRGGAASPPARGPQQGGTGR